jgi:hypothetical protein
MTGPMAVGATFVALPPPPPRITGLALSPRHWHLARRARHHHHSQPATHARMAIRINVKSTVVLQVQVARPGKRVNGNCVAFHGRAPKGKQRCTRFATQHESRTLHLLAGTTRFTLTPRVVKRQLKPGTYRLQLTATNAIGQSTVAQSKQFVVAR